MIALGFITMLSCIAIVDTLNTGADTFTIDNLEYEITSDTEVKVINCDNSEEIVIPSTVTFFGKKYNVTAIGNDAFGMCEYLVSLIIPNSVTYIGDCAFEQCEALKSMTIPDSVVYLGESALSECVSLTSVIVGNGVKSIKEYTFMFCDSLTTVSLGTSVTSIDENAFFDCAELEYVYIHQSEMVTEISQNAFESCDKLQDIYVPYSEYKDYLSSTQWSSMLSYLKPSTIPTKDIADNDLNQTLSAWPTAHTSI